MLTRQGWTVGLGGGALLVCARLLGVVELYVLGAVALLLLIGCGLYVARTALDLSVDREVHPRRVHAGSPSRVELRLENLRLAATPVLRLHDPVSGTEGADLLVPPLAARTITSATYRLPTERRGIVKVGPLEIVVTDPFGLVQVRTGAAPATELIVSPRVDIVNPPPQTSGHDPMAGARQPHTLGRTGEDFYALRPYVVGDDLRRVHWPSSARHDQLVIRQQEVPWQGRSTVVLDVRAGLYTPPTFEVAVSAAASVLTACWKRADLVRFLTTDGHDAGFARGHAHREAVLDHLAEARLRGTGSLRGSIEVLAATGTGGPLVLVTGNIPDAELAALGRLRARFGPVIVVTVARSSHETLGRAPVTVVPVTGAEAFPLIWNRTVARRSARAEVLR